MFESPVDLARLLIRFAAAPCRDADGFDWKSYFYTFVEEHGEPVNHNGKLLFSDGWTYSALDYRGPEWPPPADASELRELYIAYWQKRRALVQNQIGATRKSIERLSSFSAALAREKSQDYQERLNWLIEDQMNTEQELKSLGA